MNEYEFNAMLARQGKKQEDVAKLLGVSISTVSRKIRGESEFKSGEIRMIKLAFGLSPEEVDLIFFSPRLA